MFGDLRTQEKEPHLPSVYLLQIIPLIVFTHIPLLFPSLFPFSREIWEENHYLGNTKITK
jgi:hypothetical protein